MAAELEWHRLFVCYTGNFDNDAGDAADVAVTVVAVEIDVVAAAVAVAIDVAVAVHVAVVLVVDAVAVVDVALSNVAGVYTRLAAAAPIVAVTVAESAMEIAFVVVVVAGAVVAHCH